MRETEMRLAGAFPKPRRTRLIAASPLLLFAVRLLYGQTTAEVATHDSTPTFSSGVNLVLVPVVVRDGKGPRHWNPPQGGFPAFRQRQASIHFEILHRDSRRSADRARHGGRDRRRGQAAKQPPQARRPIRPQRRPSPRVSSHGSSTTYIFLLGDLVRAREAADRKLADAGARHARGHLHHVRPDHARFHGRPRHAPPDADSNSAGGIRHRFALRGYPVLPG